MADKNRVADKSTMHRYRIELPILIDDLDLSVYEFRLYVRFKRRSGDGGSCWEGARALAKACGMSAGQVAKAKKGLEEKGLIRIGTKQTRGGQTDDIALTDIWPLNFKTYASSESDRVVITLPESDHHTITLPESDHHTITLTSKRSPGDRKDDVGDHGDGDDDRARAKKTLQNIPLYPATVKQILALNIDPHTLIDSVTYLQSENWGPGGIADQLRINPPAKGAPYGPTNQPTRSEHAPDRPRRSERHSRRNPERDAEFAAELAELERMAK